MHELIQLASRHIGESSVQTVNARDLHAFLEVGKDFSTWMKDRINQYGFSAGADYVAAENLSSPNLGNSKSRAQRTIDYHLTLDMAKELAMVERNEKGKQARQYFIECERRAKSHQNPADLTRMQLIEMAMQAEQERLALAAKVQDMAVTVAAHDRLAKADGSVCITNAAKDLQIPPRELFGWLSSHKWIYRRQGGRGWLAYQDRIQSGHLEHKVTTVERGDGSEKVVEQVLVTPRGLALLSRHLCMEVAS